MQRLERLVNLIAALLDTERPLTRDQVRVRVPGYATDDRSFRRAFERDKQTLRGMGLPLVTLPLDPEHPEAGEGYRIPKEAYQLPDPGLTRDETKALAVAASAVRLKSQAAAAALWKLGGEPDGPVTTTADVGLSDDDRLGLVFAARRERRRLIFEYRGKERQFEPHRLSFRNGRWYLNGHDNGYDAARTYRLDRIEGELRTSAPDAFVAPPRDEQPWLPPWQLGEEPPVEALLLVDADQADLAVRQTGPATVEELRPDGAVVLRLTVTQTDAFRSFAIGFLEHAEVLGPAELRNDFVNHLRAQAAGVRA